MTPTDQVLPTGPWRFDAEVTAAFADMLSRSIPGYAAMRAWTTRLAARYVQPGGLVVDLGASRGDAIAALRTAVPGAHYCAVEISPPMLDALRARFAGDPAVTVCPLDLRHEYPEGFACVTLAVLTVQFTPIEYRQALLARIAAHTAPGGALVLVEKVLGGTPALDAVLVDEYLRWKAEQGYTHEQIARKRLALEGVLVPVTARWNEELLTAAGFRSVECVWRALNFAAWVAVL
jgi:tRNA (cmo5U34)-methyltransferase